MCGITAISRVAERSSIGDPRQFMRLAALAIEPRGKDATGFGWSTSDGGTFYWKTPQRAQSAVADAPLPLDMKAAIGHTRWKTQGDVKDNRNNHPVVDDGIVLVHNGVVTNDWQLYRLLGTDFVKKAQVDSQVIATMMANMPLFDADHPIDVLEVLEGSAALAWFDTSKPGTLHLARVQERPLTIGWTRRGDLIMSSTPETLRNLSVWSNVKIRDFWEVPEGTFLTVEDGQVTDHLTFKPKRKTYGTNGRSGTAQAGSVQRSNGLLSYDKPPTVGSNRTDNVVPFADGAAMDDYEAWLDEQTWWAHQDAADRRAAAIDVADADVTDSALGSLRRNSDDPADDRFIDENGMTWIPIWDGDEMTDFVVLDADGKYLGITYDDDFDIVYAMAASPAGTTNQLALPRGS